MCFDQQIEKIKGHVLIFAEELEALIQSFELLFPTAEFLQNISGTKRARGLQRHFGVSPPSVHQMVLTLERTGLIRRQPGVARSTEVLVAPGPTSTRSQMIKTPMHRH